MREALERMKADLRKDDPHGHYDMVCEALAQQPVAGAELTDAELDCLKLTQMTLNTPRKLGRVWVTYHKDTIKPLLDGLWVLTNRHIAAHEAKKRGAA